VAVKELYQMIGVREVYFYSDAIGFFSLVRKLVTEHSVSHFISAVTEINRFRMWRDYFILKILTLRQGVFVQKPTKKRNSKLESIYIDCFNKVFAQSERFQKLPSRFPEVHLNFSQSVIKKFQHSIDENKSRQVIVCCPSSHMPSKIWPTERYIKVIQRTLTKHPKTVFVLIGSQMDGAIGSAIVAEIAAGGQEGGVINLIGKTTIEEAAYVISKCDFYFGNDTGPMHIACLLGKVTLSIFSARDRVGKWYPPGDKHIIKRWAVSCQGCMLDRCNRPEHPCITSISVDSVLDDIFKLLEGE
jgi:ADP-heptose:LPS heptosyltransferase